jgi:hypothetical protein
VLDLVHPGIAAPSLLELGVVAQGARAQFRAVQDHRGQRLISEGTAGARGRVV